MAGNNSIQFLRGTSSQRASCTETSLAGQPVYETDTNRLYVGDGKTNVNDLTAVKASAADEAVITDNVKDQHKGAGIKIWIGTQAEFEDLPETDEDTIYYVTDITSLLELDEALTTLKEGLADGSFKVSKAGAADNVTTQINGRAITAIFESNGTTAKNATNATNVTTNINGKAISSIFESDGVTAKKATADINGNKISTTYATIPQATRIATYTQQGQVKMASTTNGGAITNGESDDTVPTIKNICDWVRSNTLLPPARSESGTSGSIKLPSVGWYCINYASKLVAPSYSTGVFYWNGNDTYLPVSAYSVTSDIVAIKRVVNIKDGTVIVSDPDSGHIYTDFTVTYYKLA